MVKKMSVNDPPSTMVVYLLLLITPFNIVLAIPSFTMPSDWTIWLILLFAGALTALAQWAIVKAYAVADASFVQPFDHAKLPLNVLAGWMVFWMGASWSFVARRCDYCGVDCVHHALGSKKTKLVERKI